MKSLVLTSLLFILIIAVTGCFNNEATRELRKWQVTLSKEDKQPYGTYLAYQSLKYYFPDAKIEPLSKSFRFTNMGDNMKYNDAGHSLLILQGLSFHIGDYEWEQIKQFMDNGNEVILFSSLLDDKIEAELNCYKVSGGEENYFFYSDTAELDNRNLLTIGNDTKRRYGYTGRSLRGFYSFREESLEKKKKDKLYASAEVDTATSSERSSSSADRNTSSTESNSTTTDNNSNSSGTTINIVPDTLGHMYNNPDFVRFQVGEGHLTLHAAPLVLSNYFLLQNGNLDYLTAMWQTLPKNINRIYWCDYYKRTVEVSSFGILWRYPATRYALILGISLLLIYILFEGKRKQRVIPVIQPLKNESVSFVETIGRLYYNKGNHNNLAEKMSMQFLDWVRSHYFLNTNVIDENFMRQLTIKSGLPEATVMELVGMIAEIKRNEINPNDAYLYELYRTIQLFYKNNRS